MKFRTLLLVLMLLAVLGLPALAQVDLPSSAGKNLKNWEEFERSQSLRCINPVRTIENPLEVKTATYSYKLTGSRMIQLNKETKDHDLIGVVSTTKDGHPDTIANLQSYVEWWKKEGATAVIMGGDMSLEEITVEKVLTVLAEPGWPVFVIMGNNDERGAFNNAIARLNKGKYRNVFNMNLIRRVDGAIYDIVTLPGYYDERFTASRNTCVYNKADVDSVAALVKESDNPVILLSHGPPKMNGKEAIDYAFNAGNVGDPLMTDVIKKSKIPLGIFGHIVEAGGRATDISNKLIKEDVLVSEMYLNPGSASSVFWKLNSGEESVGMAALVKITKEGKASYRIMKSKPGERKSGEAKGTWEDEAMKELMDLDKPKAKAPVKPLKKDGAQ
ncbi:MAG: hypothetical protein GMKNLPBB_00105 [Myxococcota bacterium]|nr:hypothetical protein [Myxococcota bacterium]